MVSLEREDAAPGPIITGFAGGGFCVDGDVYAHGLWLTPESARGWDAPAFGDLTAAALDELLSTAPLPEFLLLGTGAALNRPSPEFIAAIETRDIGVEVMDSRAAARSWGILRAEERWIVAALMPLNDS
ncbi:MAG: hypothetical protein HKN78_10850 [Sphingomonadaceae bacterium]|nr:hypothetical protein [Sphingomonadaceae bacterium]